MTAGRVAAALALATALTLAPGAAGCASGGGRGADPVAAPPGAPDAAAPSAPAAWPIPRLSLNERAIYAEPELDRLARDLVEQLAGAVPGRPARVAFYYFTLGGEKNHLGESLAQDLASAMVRRAGDRLEVYTRRKLSRVLEEMKYQATAHVAEGTMVAAGRLAGVDLILTGWIEVRKGSEVLLDVQAIEVATGKVLAGSEAKVPLAPVTPRAAPADAGRAADEVVQAIAGQLSGPGPWRVAVYDITQSKRPYDFGETFTHMVDTRFGALHRPGLTYVTRKKLGEAAEEFERQHGKDAALYDETRVAAVGQLAGANVIVTGFGEVYRDVHAVNVEVIDVETARILAASSVLVAREGS